MRAKSGLLSGFVALAVMGVCGNGTEVFAQDKAETLTFNKDIAPIIYQNCSGCHQPGEGAPFSLLDYKSVFKRAQMIAHVVDQKYMPPWHPTRGESVYRNSRKLSKKQRKQIIAWVDAGCPEGKPVAKPAKPVLNTSGWKLGKPDMVIEMNGDFSVPANGPDIYRSFVVPVNSKKRLYVRAIDVRSTGPEVLHHVLYFSSPSKQVRALDSKSKKSGFRSMGYVRLTDLGGWAVGGQPAMLAKGLAREIPPRADIILDAHFHPSGRKQNCKIKIAIYLAEEKPEKKLFSLQVPILFGRFANIDIPAGEKAWTLKSKQPISHDIEIISVAAHAHYLGQSMKSWAVTPDGKKLNLFEIKQWDFNWQERYTYKEPILVPKGSTIYSELVYNNSKSNPHNPFNPPQRVRWGQESTDEMGSIIFNVVMKQESERHDFRDSLRAEFLNSKQGMRLKALMMQLKMLDANQDKFVTPKEIPKMYQNVLQRLDRNGDGAIDFVEIDTLGQRSGDRRFDEKKTQESPKLKREWF